MSSIKIKTPERLCLTINYWCTFGISNMLSV